MNLTRRLNYGFNYELIFFINFPNFYYVIYMLTYIVQLFSILKNFFNNKKIFKNQNKYLLYSEWRFFKNILNIYNQRLP